MRCKCCCQTNIPGYPLIWIEQDKGLICSLLSLFAFYAVEILPPLPFWSVKLNRTIPVKRLNELTRCTMRTQPAAEKQSGFFLLIALVKCPHVVYAFLQQKVSRQRARMESLCCGPIGGFAYRSHKETDGSRQKGLKCCTTFRRLFTARISFLSLP